MRLHRGRAGERRSMSEADYAELITAALPAARSGHLDRGRGSRTAHKPHRRPRAYALRGVLLCGLCDRAHDGNWNKDQAYYRCRFPAEYALAHRVGHPKTI